MRNKRLLLATVVAISACSASYNQYTVVETTYPRGRVTSADVGAAAGVFSFLGYEVVSATHERVESKWQTFYLGKDYDGSPKYEGSARVVVDIKNGKIKGQCLYRKVKGPWLFKRCTQRALLEQVEQVVGALRDYIPGFSRKVL